MSKRNNNKSSKPDYATWANPELAEAMRQKRRSSAASKHTLKARKGTRGVKNAKAIRDFYA